MRYKWNLMICIIVSVMSCTACKKAKNEEASEQVTSMIDPTQIIEQVEQVSPTEKPNKSEIDIVVPDEIGTPVVESGSSLILEPLIIDPIDEVEQITEQLPTSDIETSSQESTTQDIFANNTKAYIDAEGSTVGIRIYNNKITITDVIVSKNDKLVIPSKIDNKPVVAIGSGAFEDTNVSSVVLSRGITTIESQAFYGNTSIEKITIPSTVTNIGVNAFGNCSNLGEFDLSEQNANYCLVNGVLYNKEKTSLIRYPAARKDETCLIEDSVVSIEAGAFSMSQNLAYIFFPSSLRSVGEEAFAGCIRLDVDIPDKLIELGAFSFANCCAMSKIVVPKGIEEIAEGTFSGCEKATSIKLMGEVKEIAYSAFSNCSSVTKVEFEHSVSVIGEMAFGFCTSLKSITLPSGISEIGDMAFYSCNNLEYITIPNTVTYFGSMIFDQVSNVTIRTPKESSAVDYAAENGIGCQQQ